MDTRNKRASALGFALASLLVLPAPDGAIDQADRQQTAYCYAGIDAAALVTINAVELRDVSIGVPTVSAIVWGSPLVSGVTVSLPTVSAIAVTPDE